MIMLTFFFASCVVLAAGLLSVKKTGECLLDVLQVIHGKYDPFSDETNSGLDFFNRPGRRQGLFYKHSCK